MTTRESNVPTLRYARNPRGRKAVLDLDLNVVPQMEDQYQEGSSSHHGPWNVPPVQLGGAVPLTVIDLEAFDDDVLLSSPRAFAELQKQDLWSVAPPTPSLPPPPKEPIFTCPVCMGPLVEEMSTKCGHIFCKACIKNVIAAQNKCPTCRRKVTKKNIIRIYLPATR